MEEDRAIADLGPDTLASSEINGDAQPISKQPKRRFIGRKAADAKAASQAGAGVGEGAIEDTGAVQGARDSPACTAKLTTI
jgi:2-(3-amino-3-carboxypropyl)histidine synthase